MQEYKYKIGDKVVVHADPDEPVEYYTITKLPLNNKSIFFYDHYEGEDQADSCKGLFTEDEIVGYWEET